MPGTWYPLRSRAVRAAARTTKLLPTSTRAAVPVRRIKAFFLYADVHGEHAHRRGHLLACPGCRFGRLRGKRQQPRCGCAELEAGDRGHDEVAVGALRLPRADDPERGAGLAARARSGSAVDDLGFA